MRIAILNSVALNGGDAAIVFGTCDAIRQYIPEAEIGVYCHGARYARGYYPELTIGPMLQDEWPGTSIRDRALRRSFIVRDNFGLLDKQEKNFYRAVYGADGVVYVGGGYLTDHYQTRNLLWMMERTAGSGVPHMAYAQSFGPFYKESTMKGVKTALDSFGAVTTRDRASFDLLVSLGLPRSKLHFTADAAFSMRPHEAENVPVSDRQAADQIGRFKERGAKNKMLLVSVREWTFPNQPNALELQKQSRTGIRSFLEKVLNETDWKICFLSTCQGRPEYNFDDSKKADDLIRDLPEGFKERIFISRHPFHPRSYPHVIKSYADLVVSMRMHIVILAIMAGIPFIALAYEQKSRELARQVGVEEYCLDLSGLQGDLLFTTFLNAISKMDGLAGVLQRALPDLVTRSMQNADILAGIL